MATRTTPRTPPSAKAWDEVGKNLSSLGKDLRRHFDEAADDIGAERAAVEKSVRLLVASLEDGFGAIGKVVRDPELRKDVAEAAVSVREALLATFDSAGEQVLQRVPAPVSARARTAAGRARAVATKATKATKAVPAKAKATARKAAPKAAPRPRKVAGKAQ